MRVMPVMPANVEKCQSNPKKPGNGRMQLSDIFCNVTASIRLSMVPSTAGRPFSHGFEGGKIGNFNFLAGLITFKGRYSG